MNQKKAAKIAAILASIAISGCAGSPPPLPQVKSGEFKPVASQEWKEKIETSYSKSGR